MKMSDVRDYFFKLDRDGSGLIDAQELLDELTSGGEALGIEQVRAIIEEFDKNGDGKLDYEEICTALFTSQ